MARPKAEVIWREPEQGKTKITELLRTQSLWVIMYDGQPVRQCSIDVLVPEYPTKYVSTVYHNQAHAERRLKLLQRLTKLDGFWLKRIDFDSK